MTINSLNSSSNNDDCIHLLKKNMKVPSTIKLIGVLGHNCLQVFKKNTDEPLIKVRYGPNIDYKIIRHSNTGILLRQEEYFVEITLESSYQRDLFALVFKQLNHHFLADISKTDLQEIDFFKRRESYLEKQMTTNQVKFNQDLKKL